MWNYALNNSEHAQATEEEITTLITNGKISPDTLVWKSGMDSWAEAKDTELGKVIQLHQKHGAPPPLQGISSQFSTTHIENNNVPKNSYTSLLPLISTPIAICTALMVWKFFPNVPKIWFIVGAGILASIVTYIANYLINNNKS